MLHRWYQTHSLFRCVESRFDSSQVVRDLISSYNTFRLSSTDEREGLGTRQKELLRHNMEIHEGIHGVQSPSASADRDSEGAAGGSALEDVRSNSRGKSMDRLQIIYFILL